MPSVKNVRRIIQQNAVFYLAAILIALALKQHYSQAIAGDLDWILSPTAGLVSLITGDKFSFQAGTGYVCDTQRIIIAPACAGVNFMLMAFGMSVFTGTHHMESPRHRLLWLAGSLAASYGVTLMVNTLRIIVSIHTFHENIFSGGFMWQWVHRLEGIVIYFFFQYLFYSMIRGVIRQYVEKEPGRKTVSHMAGSNGTVDIRKSAFPCLIPCVWYIGVTLVIPFLNGAPAKTGGLFYNHAAMVLALCMITWACITAVALCGQGVRLLFTGGYRKHEIPNPDC
jgi:exosortase K